MAKSKQMTKSSKAPTSKKPKPRGRSGGRSPLSPEEKKQQANLYLPAWLYTAFQKLIPTAVDRSNLIASWVRTYVTANGESDRLLTQSSVAGEVLTYLEATNAPQELRDKLESAIVARASDETKIDRGVVQVGDSYIL